MGRKLFTLFVGMLVLTLLVSAVHSQDPTRLDLVEDAAGMFNERGYSTNSTSFNGSEAINNYNGNLIYTQPLEYIPISQNGLKLDLKLTYNGDVGHVSPTGWQRRQPNEQHRMISHNAPEWIVSLNGIAIQVLNFENECVTWADSATVARESNVATLVNGYHNCHSWNNKQDTVHGVISILMGDGSVRQYISLVDTISSPSYIWGRVIVGDYRSFTKEDRSKGILHGDATFTLFQDDGTTVRFDLYRPNWRDSVTNTTIDAADSLVMLLPVEFRDRHNHGLHIEYFESGDPVGCCGNYSQFGRPPVRRISESLGPTWIDFWWHPYGDDELILKRDGSTRWTIHYRDWSNGNHPAICEDNARAMVDYVINPGGLQTEFDYTPYRRISDNVADILDADSVTRCSLGGFHTRANIHAVTHHRLQQISYPDGGESYFTYYDDQLSQYPNLTSTLDVRAVDFGTQCYNELMYPCHASSAFDDIGRDPFFLNMVAAARRVVNDTVIATDSLIFDWYDDGGSGWISGADSFWTTRYQGSATATGSNIYRTSTYLYRQYQENGPYSDLSRDRGWVTKLMRTVEEEEAGQESGATRTTTNVWRFSGGTRMLDSVTVTADGVTEVTDYDYVWADTTIKNSTILSQSTTDSWGLKSTKHFDSTYVNVDDSTDYYTNALVDRVWVTGSLGGSLDTIAKTANEYYGLTDTLGFEGQLKKSTTYVYEIYGGSDSTVLADSVAQQYEYYATQSELEHASWDYGALRKRVGPRGDSVVYRNTEPEVLPVGWTGYQYWSNASGGPVVYKTLNRDGSIDTISTNFINGPFWNRMDIFLSDTAYGWVDIRAKDTVFEYCGVTADTGSSASATAYMPHGQTVNYHLKRGRDNCDTGGESHAWIELDGVMKDSIWCDGDSISGASDTVGSFWAGGYSDISVHVASTMPGKEEIYRRNTAEFWFVDTTDLTIDTIGTEGLDKISYHRLVDPHGLTEKVVDPNGFASFITYDSLNRVNQVTLPGSHKPVDSSFVADTVLISHRYHPTLDGRHNVAFDEEIAYCWAALLQCEEKLSKLGPAVDFSYAPLFMFGGVDFRIYEQIDSAFLLVHCTSTSAGSIKVCTYVDDWIEDCSESYFVDDMSASVSISTGLDTIDVTSEVEDWFDDPLGRAVYALSLKWSSGDPKWFASSDHADSTKWPTLVIYSQTVQDHRPYVSIDYDFDDSPSDGDEVSVNIKTVYDNDTTTFPRTAEVWFDGYGRAIRSGASESADSVIYSYTEYDFADRDTAHTDPLNNTTWSKYDGLDRPTRTTHPDPNASYTSITYGGTGASGLGFPSGFGFADSSLYRKTFRDENGHLVKEYTDVRDLLRLRERFDGGYTLQTFFDYDLYGNLTLVIRPEGDSVRYWYNSLGWLLKEVSADYDTVRYAYDRNGNMIRKQDGVLDAKTGGDYWLYYDYDALKRITQSGVFDSSTTIRDTIQHYFFDQEAQELSIGRLSLTYNEDTRYGEEYHYDARGRLKRQINYFDADLEFTDVDSVYALQCVSGTTTDSMFIHTYDSVTIDYELTKTSVQNASSYARVFRNGTLLAYCNKATSSTVSGSFTCVNGDCVKVETYIPPRGEGIFAQLTAEAGYTRYYRDQAFLRPDYEAQTCAHVYEIEYEYNLADQVTQITYPAYSTSNPDNIEVTYHYDDLGRLASVGNESDSNFYSSQTYTDRSEVETVVYYDTSGTALQTVNHAYNERGWLTNINDSSTAGTSTPNDLFAQELDYYAGGDRNGNIGLSYEYVSDTGTTYRYTYDDLDRVSSRAAEWPSMYYDALYYDRNGNIGSRYQERPDTAMRAYAYSAGSNQVCSVYVTGGPTNKYEYNENGSLAEDSTASAYTAYHYNAYGQLDTVTFPGHQDWIVYHYNNNGERVLKYQKDYWIGECEDDDPTKLRGGPDTCQHEGSVTTRYIRSKGKVLAEFDVRDSCLSQHIYAGDQRIVTYGVAGHGSAPEQYFYLNDHLGSVRAVMHDPGGAFESPEVVSYVNYHPFGGVSESWVGAHQTDFTFTGKEFDDERGFDHYYFGARYYNPATGRFTSIDKAGQFASGFAYGGNSPMMGIDRDGNLFGIDDLLIAATIGGIMGGYSGYQYAEATGHNPLLCMIGGAIIGASAGYVGATVANTTAVGGLAAASGANSTGWKLMTGGKSDFTLNFGFGQWNLDQGSWGWADFSGNFWEDLNAVSGWLAVTDDMSKVEYAIFENAETKAYDRTVQEVMNTSDPVEVKNVWEYYDVSGNGSLPSPHYNPLQKLWSEFGGGDSGDIHLRTRMFHIVGKADRFLSHQNRFPAMALGGLGAIPHFFLEGSFRDVCVPFPLNYLLDVPRWTVTHYSRYPYGYVGPF